MRISARRMGAGRNDDGDGLRTLAISTKARNALIHHGCATLADVAVVRREIEGNMVPELGKRAIGQVRVSDNLMRLDDIARVLLAQDVDGDGRVDTVDTGEL